MSFFFFFFHAKDGIRDLVRSLGLGDVYKRQHWDILYPTISLDNKIKLGYTSYISEKMIERCKSPKPFSSRRTDVSYRSKLSYLGQMRYTKGTIGNVFVNNIPFSDYVLNISTHPKDTIFGERWLDFIEDSKFVLGSNSGSSILDLSLIHI